MENYLFLPRFLIAALSDIAFAGAAGLAVASFLLPPRERNSPTRRPILLCAATLVATTLAQIYLTTATMIATAAPTQVLAQLRSVALETHTGRLLLANALVTLLLVALATISRARWPITGTLILLVTTRATIGHAASDGDFTLAELVQFTHLVSTAIWSGLILSASFIVLPKLPPEAVSHFTRRLSTTVTVALVFIPGSGAYNSYRGVGGTLLPLRNSQWETLLVVKILLVFAALALGLLNRRILHHKVLLSHLQIVQLKRQMRAEAILMLMILTVSAALANSPPAA